MNILSANTVSGLLAKRSFRLLVAGLSAIIMAVSFPVETSACTNLLVGKDASTDGSTMISYAADSYGMFGFLHFVPAADHQPGEMREVKDWDTGRPQGFIPQVAHTYTVVGNMNEHQVTVGETTWGGREELWDTVGIDYGSLIYIALERSKTAREAIEWFITLVNEYGYASEGESFSFGDPNEIWIMDLIGKGKGQKGANWVAVRIPDNAISAHANQSRITTIPVAAKHKLTKEEKRLEKKLNCVCKGDWMWSKDLISFAREKGYFKGADKDFSFQAAFNPFDFSGLYVCEARVWSFFNHFVPGMDKYFDYATGAIYRKMKNEQKLNDQMVNAQMVNYAMPLWFVPERKVSAQDLKECMRDEYRGTPLDITQGTDAGPWNSKLRYGGLGFKLSNSPKDDLTAKRSNSDSGLTGEAGPAADTLQYWYERPIATQQTAWSFVAQMRPYNKNGIFWFGVDDAACSCYAPMYSCLTRVPECFAEGNGDSYTFSQTSAWWTFNLVANWAYTKYSRMYPHIQEAQQVLDDKFNTQIAGVDAQAAELDEKAAREFLTNYSCAQATNMTNDWQKLYIYLVTKFIDGQERKEENGDFKRNRYGHSCGPNRLALPENFLRMVAPEITHE